MHQRCYLAEALDAVSMPALRFSAWLSAAIFSAW
jgi:hypothetical protein